MHVFVLIIFEPLTFNNDKHAQQLSTASIYLYVIYKVYSADIVLVIQGEKPPKHNQTTYMRMFIEHIFRCVFSSIYCKA